MVKVNYDNTTNILKENECKKIQNQLRNYIVLQSRFKFDDIKIIAGIDLAYWGKHEYEYAVCCIVVINSITREVIEKIHSIGKIEFPYIPGCLAFRELPLVLETAKKLKNNPDLYIFDGNGYLHPRHMGIATHASLYLNKPTIGVAKSYYKINDVDFIMPDNYDGAYTNIVINEEVYGRVLRTQKDVKPIFLSAGNYIDLETSTKIIKNLITKESHIPIPTRLADMETHKMRIYYKSQYI